MKFITLNAWLVTKLTNYIVKPIPQLYHLIVLSLKILIKIHRINYNYNGTGKITVKTIPFNKRSTLNTKEIIANIK